MERFTHKLQRWGAACVVCLEDFEQGDEVARLSCGHNFHEQCVRRWLRHRAQCPYRCSGDDVLKRKQWEAEELADEAAECDENGVQSDILSSMSNENEIRDIRLQGRASVYLCTHLSFAPFAYSQ